MMPWASTAISVGGSLLGGLMGGSKSGERAAKDAAARAQFAQEAAAASAKAEIRPFIDEGKNASNELAYLLGTGGYDVPMPNFDFYYNDVKSTYGGGFGKGARQINHAQFLQQAQGNYEAAMANWKKGFEAWKTTKQQQDPNFGYLKRNFTNEDFVEEPGYKFRLLEGEKGINRNGIARGSFDSGAALKELERFRQDYASNEFGNAYSRDSANKARIYDMLSGRTQTGLNAVGVSTGAGQTAANNIGNIGINSANNMLLSAQNRADNQSNAFQQALSNLVYGMNRNNGRIDENYSGGSSSSSSTPFYKQLLV